MRALTSTALLSLLALSAPAAAQDLIEIRPGESSIVVDTEEGWIEITRQKTEAMLIVAPLQPEVPVEGVTPVGELEVIDALQDGTTAVVDMRTPEWRAKSTIPGSRHMPYDVVADRLDELGCTLEIDGWDCAEAIPVVAFCNGPSCGQSPAAIRNMVDAGFPADRISYYRGGMQAWINNGLTAVRGDTGEVVTADD